MKRFSNFLIRFLSKIFKWYRNIQSNKPAFDIYIDSNKVAELILNEVPGDSLDARHIYEKLGFKENGILTTPEENRA